MVNFPRQIIPDSIEKVESYFKNSNVLLISGPSQCGKSYVVHSFLDHFPEDKQITFDGTNMSQRIVIMNNDVTELAKFVRGKEIVFIDAAQRIPDAYGVIDTILEIDSEIKIVIAYSTREIEDKNQIRIYPIAYSSLKKIYSSTPDIELVEECLIYGTLPQVLLATDIPSRIKTLDHITNTDILKDLFELANIANSKALMDLLYYLALNINKTLSINDIAKHINTNPRTVRRYIDLLEKHYIIHEHKPFKAGISGTILTFSRYYFYDLGIRNSLINNFAKLNLRGKEEQEQLWANFLVMERHKAGELHNLSHSTDYESYFWETYAKGDIDLVEVDHQNDEVQLFKFGLYDIKKLRMKKPDAWSKKYPDTSYTVINIDTFNEFVGVAVRN